MPDAALLSADPALPAGRFTLASQDLRHATHDIYRLPHKAIRHAGAQMLMRLGNAGWEDALDSAGLVADLQLLLDFIRRHMEEEEDVIHPAIELRLPSFCQVVERQHRRQQARLSDMDLLIARMARNGEDERPTVGHQLYLAFAAFFGDQLCHMQEEETAVLPMLQQIFTDAEILGMEQRIFDQIPLDTMLGCIRRLVPALNPRERAQLMRGLREGMPTEAFLAILERAARPTLTTPDWLDLLFRLEMETIS